MYAVNHDDFMSRWRTTNQAPSTAPKTPPQQNEYNPSLTSEQKTGDNTVLPLICYPGDDFGSRDLLRVRVDSALAPFEESS